MYKRQYRDVVISGWPSCLVCLSVYQGRFDIFAQFGEGGVNLHDTSNNTDYTCFEGLLVASFLGARYQGCIYTAVHRLRNRPRSSSRTMKMLCMLGA